MRPRWWVLTAVAVFLLAIATNILVAWAPALRRRSLSLNDYPWRETRHEAVFLIDPLDGSPERWAACIAHADPTQVRVCLGLLRDVARRTEASDWPSDVFKILWEAQAEETRDQLQPLFFPNGDAVPLPGWFNPKEHSKLDCIVRVYRGWPLPSLSHDWLFYRTGHLAYTHSVMHRPWNPLPLRPDPLPFLANTAFYAALWLIPLVLIPRTLRGRIHTRRKRRGHCPTCNYNLNHDLTPGCPECGWNREQPTPA